MEKILDDIRDNVHDVLKVQTLITKKDLWNIKIDFHLYEGRQHSSDYISVNMWINRMIELPDEENPVVHYNLEKENFILVISTNFQLQMFKHFGSSSNSKICIDSTHCTNEYGLQLTTIVVVDEFGNGFPCAYCISKNTDAETWKIFFQKLKSKIGIISTQIFMSDDDPSYYNAW